MSDHHQNESSHVDTQDVGRLVRLVLALALIAAIIIVALDNRDDVRIGWAIGDTEAPLWIALVAAAVAGAIIGYLISHRPRHRH